MIELLNAADYMRPKKTSPTIFCCIYQNGPRLERFDRHFYFFLL